MEGLVKYPMYGLYHRSLLVWEDEQERLENQDLIRREAATGRPWWWTSSNERRRGNPQLTQALLADDNGNAHNTNNDGGGSTTTNSRRRQRRGLFGLMFGGRQVNANDFSTRDDGSVDFASVLAQLGRDVFEGHGWEAYDSGEKEPPKP